MRDALGYVCLILFVPAVIALVLSATRPELFVRRRSGRADEMPPEAGTAPPATAPSGPPSAPPRRGLVIAVFAGAAAVLAGLTYFLLLAPTYAVTVKPPEEIVAAPGSKVPIEVANNGALGGDFHSTPTVDGKEVAEVSGEVTAGKTTKLEVALPDDLAAGKHALEVGGTAFAFTALRPAEFEVGKLAVDPEVAKVRQEIAVAVNVENTGEATGVFPGVLEADGKEAATAPTEIAGGERVPVYIRFSQPKTGKCRLNVSGSKAAVMVVRPVRLGNGAVLKNSLGGGGSLIVVQNRYPYDAMLCLTSSRSAKKPLLAVYVRGRKSASVGGLRPGTYYVFFSIGKDWNRYTDDFLTSYGRERFAKPAEFRTRQWTSRSIDYAARMIYTTLYTQSTRFTITIGSSSGKKKAKAVEVSGDRFPTP